MYCRTSGPVTQRAKPAQGRLSKLAEATYRVKPVMSLRSKPLNSIGQGWYLLHQPHWARRASRPRPSKGADKKMKTNAVRLLETLGVQYELREYEVDPDDLAAETVAAKIGLPPEQVFKTLLARGDRHGLCFAVIPANTELDLKALAAATGDRKMELVPVKELLSLTGYIRGGVTVLGAKKSFPVFADETIQLWDSISISAGVRGTQMILRPEDYLRATEAVMADIARGK